MAGFVGKEITNTYKDILNVFGTIENEGFTSSAKRIFDGAGVGSPVWISTNLLQVGTLASNANLDVYGIVIAKEFHLRSSIGTAYSVMGVQTDGTVHINADLETKGSVKFLATSGDDLIMDANAKAFQRGDGTKGNITLEDSSVKLQKGSTDLLEVKEDGTITFQNISSYPSSPSAGDIVLKGGNLEIYT